MARVSRIMLKQLPEMRLLTVRKTIDFMKAYSDFMGEALGCLLALIEANKTFPASGPIVCFHNTRLDTLDVEVGFQVAQPIAPAGGVQAVTLPSCTVALTIDRGPYEAQDPTLEGLMRWVAENGYTPSGGIYYHYLNDEEQPPGEYLTEMFIPVGIPAGR